MATRRILLGATLALPALNARAQGGWPERSVRFVVSFAPGGFVDLIGRGLGEQLGPIWRHPVVVENRGGAGGNLATQQIARAAPDGYTALVTSGAFAINVTLSRNPGYRPEDFRVASVVAGTPNLFVVRADSPIRSMRDLVETARRRPLNYGTAGVGVAAHLSTELFFKRVGGTDAQHVPFTGAGPAMLALLAGTVDMVATSLPSAVSQVQAGQARGIAVTNDRRNGALPDVPTVAEAGFEPIVDIAWVAVMFPAAVPAPIVEKVNADIGTALRSDAFRARLAGQGFEPIGGSVQQVNDYVAREVTMWRDIVRAINIQLD
jgi:tripartite-type tricarboxylate transporter receptor subunit TctC